MATRPTDSASPTLTEQVSSSPAQKATKRRAPPPSLASLDRLNPFKTPSASTPPNYLTPPVTNIPLYSPPPLSIANDYLNAHVNHKKRHTAGSMKSQASSGNNGQPLDSLLVRNFVSPTGRPEFQDTSSVAARVDEKGSALDPAVEVKRQATLTLSTPTISSPEVQGEVAFPSHGSFDSKDDTAATALRSINQVTKESSLFGSRRLSRISQALVTAIHQPKAFAGGEDGRAAGTSEDPRFDRENDIADSPTLHQLSRPTSHLFKGTHLGFDTPATITLRKASDAYFVVIGGATVGNSSRPGSISFSPKPNPSDRKPSVALMDFRSKRLTEHRKSLWYSLPLLSDQTPQAESPTKDDDTKQKIITQESDYESSDIFNNVQRPSAIAEPAVTFADVHTAPQSFASVPYSRSRSSSTVKKIRRTSSVRIETRSSVHEVIWREDEHSSGTSSQGSISPIQTDKVPQRPSAEAPTSPSLMITSHSAPATPSIHLSNPTLQVLPQENIFDWSWNAQKAGPPTSTVSPVDPPMSAPVPEAAVDVTPRRRSVSKESSSASVESFPPLMDRQNTTEWRRAPLVDLNDPMAGRVTRMWLPHITTNGVEELRGLGEEPAKSGAGKKQPSMDGPGGSEGVGEQRRRSSVHPFAPARLGLKGRVGSSIGASSHKKLVWFT
ncbi:MAG: hypothetical protein Q9195_004564 [Heterodermia aff. obscurata]